MIAEKSNGRKEDFSILDFYIYNNLHNQNKNVTFHDK